MFEFVSSGESARLLCLWNGLDIASSMPHPMMGLLARPFGLTNLLSLFLGVVAACEIFVLVRRIVRFNTNGEYTATDANFAGRLAASAAAALFVLSPAMLQALTNVEPALFGLVVTLAAFLLLTAAVYSRIMLAFALMPLAGLLLGFFAGECSLAVLAGLLAAFVILLLFSHRVKIGFAFSALAVFAFGFALGFFVYVGVFASNFGAALVFVQHEFLKQVSLAHGGALRAVFAVLPFFATLLILPRAFGDGLWMRRVTLSHLAVLPLVLLGLCAHLRADAIVSAALISVVFGELLAYFAVSARFDFRHRPPVGTRFRNVRFVSRTLVVGFLVLVGLMVGIRNVMQIDQSSVFVSRLAEHVLDHLGSRTWLVTDGRIDNHLRLLAAQREQDVVFVNLNRDFDPAAKHALSVAIRQRLGEHAPELLRSLELGILPFLEDWVKMDPQAPQKLAVLAAPDVLFACGINPVPELFFFGADPQTVSDWTLWPRLNTLLFAPKGWGSSRLADERDAVTRLRLDLRRHLGLVANNRGVWLQDHGDQDGAFRFYTRVLDEIDSDNVSALFNLLQMADDGYAPAVARASALRRKVKTLVADESRRYRLWALANYYGTIRNVPALLSLGFNWARSGRPGEALLQIRRAADLVPTDHRAALMNMIALLLAEADQYQQSRLIYERRLAEKSDDHTALMGLVRLELLAGDEEKARVYLERAVATGGDDPRIQIELALLSLMKGDVSHARNLLLATTAANPDNLRAWSFLAAVTMQLSDATKDPAARAALDRELEEKILPRMQTRARGLDDYYVYSTRAFLAMRKGEAGRTAAREALLSAVQKRPDVPVTREMLLGLDVALNDSVSAELHARQILRMDRQSPMANYVMGSLALGRDQLDDAEAYLKRAVAPKKPGGFALNDYAEVLRLRGRYQEAESFARRVVHEFPNLYAGWDTLAAVILDQKGDVDAALAAATEAVQLVTRDGRAGDAGTLLTLARAQKIKGEKKRFNMTMRKLEGRQDELTSRQMQMFKDLKEL